MLVLRLGRRRPAPRRHDPACAQARAALGDVETVEVKTAITRYAARSVHPAVAQDRIRSGATRAVQRAPGMKPFTPAPPFALEIDFVNSACADAAELVPQTRRIDGLTCAYACADAPTLIQVIQAWTILAGSTVV